MRAEVEMERAQVESQLAQFGHTPGASHAASPAQQRITIEFDTSGLYTVDGESLTGEELQIYLTEKAAATPGGISVELRPADDTAYVLVSGVTAICEKAGVKDVSVGKVEKSDE
jgi:biopolymer transport protein ExbD